MSPPNRQVLATIMNCSTQLYSTRSMVNGDGDHLEKGNGGCEKRTTLSLVYVSIGSYSSQARLGDMNEESKARD